MGWVVQAILALVHDLGANWDLVSDVLSSNSQIKVRIDAWWAWGCGDGSQSLSERLGSRDGVGGLSMMCGGRCWRTRWVVSVVVVD